MDGEDSSGESTGLLDYLKEGVNLGTTVYGAINAPTPTPATTANATARADSATQSQLLKYLPWAIGGFVVLILAVVFLGRK